MSSANALSTPAQSRRRYHARRRIDGLIYVDFGPDNGAILIDLGEGGLGFQSVVPVSIDQAVLLKFKVPGETNPVEGYAEVAWLNESGKGGGLRFVELGENSRAQIRGFAGELLPEPDALQSVDAAEPDAGPETATGGSSANGLHASPAPEASTADRAPSQASQSFTAAENTQPPSPHAAPIGQNEAAQTETAQNEVAHSEVPASPGVAAAASLTEFMVEIDAERMPPIPSLQVTFDAPLPETPIAATQVVDSPAWESAKPPEEQNTPEEQSAPQEQNSPRNKTWKMSQPPTIPLAPPPAFPKLLRTLSQLWHSARIPKSPRRHTPRPPPRNCRPNRRAFRERLSTRRL